MGGEEKKIVIGIEERTSGLDKTKSKLEELVKQTTDLQKSFSEKIKEGSKSFEDLGREIERTQKSIADLSKEIHSIDRNDSFKGLASSMESLASRATRVVEVMRKIKEEQKLLEGDPSRLATPEGQARAAALERRASAAVGSLATHASAIDATTADVGGADAVASSVGGGARGGSTTVLGVLGGTNRVLGGLARGGIGAGATALAGLLGGPVGLALLAAGGIGMAGAQLYRSWSVAGMQRDIFRAQESPLMAGRAEAYSHRSTQAVLGGNFDEFLARTLPGGEEAFQRAASDGVVENTLSSRQFWASKGAPFADLWKSRFDREGQLEHRALALLRAERYITERGGSLDSLFERVDKKIADGWSPREAINSELPLLQEPLLHEFLGDPEERSLIRDTLGAARSDARSRAMDLVIASDPITLAARRQLISSANARAVDDRALAQEGEAHWAGRSTLMGLPESEKRAIAWGIRGLAGTGAATVANTQEGVDLVRNFRLSSSAAGEIIGSLARGGGGSATRLLDVATEYGGTQDSAWLEAFGRTVAGMSVARGGRIDPTGMVPILAEGIGGNMQYLQDRMTALQYLDPSHSDPFTDTETFRAVSRVVEGTGFDDYRIKLALNRMEISELVSASHGKFSEHLQRLGFDPGNEQHIALVRQVLQERTRSSIGSRLSMESRRAWDRAVAAGEEADFFKDNALAIEELGWTTGMNPREAVQAAEMMAQISSGNLGDLDSKHVARVLSPYTTIQAGTELGEVGYAQLSETQQGFVHALKAMTAALGETVDILKAKLSPEMWAEFAISVDEATRSLHGLKNYSEEVNYSGRLTPY